MDLEEEEDVRPIILRDVEQCSEYDAEPELGDSTGTFFPMEEDRSKHKKPRVTCKSVTVIGALCFIYVFGIMWLVSSHYSIAVITTLGVAVFIFVFFLCVTHTPGRASQFVRSMVLCCPLLGPLFRSRSSKMQFKDSIITIPGSE